MQNRILKTELVEWKKLKPFQPDDFKNKTKKDHDRLKESIKKNGLSAPFYIWETNGEKYIIDGHTRIPILYELENVPELLPAIFLHFDTIQEAKKAVLIYNSHYASVNQDSFEKFIIDLNFDEISEEININAIEIYKSISLDEYNDKKIKQEKEKLKFTFYFKNKERKKIFFEKVMIKYNLTDNNYDEIFDKILEDI